MIAGPVIIAVALAFEASAVAAAAQGQARIHLACFTREASITDTDRISIRDLTLSVRATVELATRIVPIAVWTKPRLVAHTLASVCITGAMIAALNAEALVFHVTLWA